MLSYKKLQITYCDPNNQFDNIKIDYRLRDTVITTKWIQRVLLAQKLNYSIDDPTRFYGFGSIHEQETAAIKAITRTIDRLSAWISIDKELKSVDDQDTLNYLHHIFEVEHGLLDVKNNNNGLQETLCDLNLMIHRCESIARGAHPRHVVTYFGLPKTELLDNNDYQYFDHKVSSGTVYINYAEIGKTLYDLFLDNDAYIKPEAFQPFNHYSADFVVRFWNDDNRDLHHLLHNYYNKHQDFFISLGYTWDNLEKSIGSIPVADLDHKGDILKQLETRQFVKAVHFL
jgi:hypothetical protein